jgi:AraC family transcriptional regulator of adaptative response/methylated-DNA-[protein]-cysteine methyltransferase
MQTSVSHDSRWAAVAARDVRADGTFFYSVSTTGVYCRPSCGARRPRPEHVRFHATAEAAEAAGFRPCRRCRPDGPPPERVQAARIAQACRLLERAEPGQTPRLSTLARHAGLSPYHFHRLFKAATGLTPRRYAAAHRASRVRRALEKGDGTVTEAMYDAGFSSGSRFYEASDAMLGMTPTRYRNGGVQTEIRFAVGECSLGSILVAQSARGVCAILLGDDPGALVRDLQDRFPRATFVGGDRAFEQTIARVVSLVEHPARRFDLPLDLQGTAFQQRVWQALRKIPIGTTATYADIAARIGAPAAARAVAQACSRNPVAVAIPCHRVVRMDGSLSGYRWGVERKKALLEREGVSARS